LTKLQELQQRRLAVSEQLTDIGKAGFKNEDERKRFDALQIEAKGLGDDIARLEAASTLEGELRQTQRPLNGPINPSQDETSEQRWNRLRAEKKTAKRARQLTERAEKAAFRLWALTGAAHPLLRGNQMNADSPEVKRLMTELRTFRADPSVIPPAVGPTFPNWTPGQGIGSPVASIPTSVFVPQGFIYDIEIALKAIGNFISAADDIPTSTGAPLPYPTSNDVTVEAEIVGEGQTVSNQDVFIGNIVLQAWKYDTKLVPVSLELLQDSAFDMDKFLTAAFAIRLQRGLTRDFTNGNGVNCPRGILLDAVLGATAVGAAANAPTGSSVDGTNSIGTTDLLSLIHSVDPLYRINGKFMAHDYTLQTLEQTLDKFGRPLYLPNPQTGKLESLFGYPIVLNQYMPQLDPTSPETQPTPVIFGDLKKYKVRRVRDLAVLRLVERAAEQGLVLFIAFARYDGRLADAGTHPVKYLQMAA
jgi:HK97 family phage major capsid protein